MRHYARRPPGARAAVEITAVGAELIVTDRTEVVRRRTGLPAAEAVERVALLGPDELHEMIALANIMLDTLEPEEVAS